MFSASKTAFPRNFDSLISVEITEEDNRRLGRIPDDVEIWEAVKGIGGLKAPGPDGFTATFYKKHWNTVKTKVIGMVPNFFISGLQANESFQYHT